MNYKKIYDSLMERATNRNLTGHTELHHIIPRCMGGEDNVKNLVRLTPEEHYLVHQLLVKIYPDHHGLAKAALMMTFNRTNNKLYGWIRRRAAKAMSESQSGSGNSQYGTYWIYNNELEISKKISGEIPKGWERGRIVDFGLHKKRIIEQKKQKQNKKETKIKKYQKTQRIAYGWYDKYKKSGCKSIREFVIESDYDKSHVSFCRMLKKYVDEFSPIQGRGFVAAL